LKNLEIKRKNEKGKKRKRKERGQVQGQDLLESIKTNRRRMMGHGLISLLFVPLLPGLFCKEIQGSMVYVDNP
jgi:hypothetical protein